MDETTSSSTDKRCKAKEDTSSTTEEEVEKVGLEQNPEEGAAEGAEGKNTATPGKMTGKPQNVFSPPSRVSGDRQGKGTTPGQESYSGKSAEADLDLRKSPLYTDFSKQLERLEKTFGQKMDGVEKSFTERMDSIKKSIDNVEKFYKQPFYKAVVDTPENAKSETVADKVNIGTLRFTQ
jgi:hypothetical protein